MFATAQESRDPLVLLDAAKLKLSDGRLTQAAELLAGIPTVSAEPYIAEEVVFQQMIVSSAFLRAAHHLYQALEQPGLASTDYGAWLLAEREAYARSFERHAAEFLSRTEKGFHLEFVRFRLPLVSDEHLQDVSLYADPMMIEVACNNWADGREGLGRGLLKPQARVALVLAAAVHYDMDEASQTLEAVSRRLRAGVPLDPVITMDWLASIASELAAGDNGLAAIAAAADERILALTESDPTHPLRAGALERLAINTEPISSSE
ncbi:hypothetical protein IIA79_06300 [bacterium]|nr:hypothetical protein [bacterium]